MIDILSQYDVRVLEIALAYAFHLCNFGVNVAEKWKTATEQANALSNAYRKGYSDAKGAKDG